MKLTGLEVLDSTIQRTNGWIKELMQELNWSDRRKTYLAMRSVLHALRDHLPVASAAYVGEQLPMLIRGVYYEHWEPEGKPIPWRSREEFLAVLSSHLEESGESVAATERIIRAVFRVLDRKATEGEIQEIQSVLPRELQDLWPPTLRAA